MINKYKNTTIAIFIALSASSSFASSVGAQSQVTAEIENSCILTNPLNLSFEYDNLNGHQAQQSMGIKCTTGANYKIVLDYGLNGDGQKRRLNNNKNGDLLSYQIYKKGESVVVGDGKDGSSVFEGIYAAQEELLLDMDVKVAPGQYVSSGLYTDTVVANIQY